MAKKIIFICSIFFCVTSLFVFAQEKDSTQFNVSLYNKEYKVFMRINAYAQDVIIPGQEVFGEMNGYLKGDGNSYAWLVTECILSNDGNTVNLAFTNDAGSEDFTATLTVNKDGIYNLSYIDGSTFKIPRNKKWLKLPKTMEFERKK